MLKKNNNNKKCKVEHIKLNREEVLIICMGSIKPENKEQKNNVR